MELSIEKFKKYVDNEFSLEQLEALEDIINDRLIMLKTAIDKANHKPIKGFSINEQEEAEAFIYESLRDWFKKEKWVRISSSGKIAGKCGTSKNKKNPDRCLPLAKARSLTKGQRAATAAKKKKAGKKGKTVVKNTKKATVKKEAKEQWPEEIHSRHKEYIFKLVKIGSDRAKYSVIDIETGEQTGTIVFNTVNQLQDFANDYIKPQSGRQSSHFGTNESIDKVTGGIPYRVEGGRAIISEPLDDATKQRIFKRCKEAGYRCAPNQAGGVTIMLKKGTFESQKVTKEDIRNLVVGTIHEMQNEGTIEEKDDRCTRLAKQKYDTWPSAYASGAVVRCRRGEIWKKK